MILDYAIEHARQGRAIFPGIPNEKTPAIKNPYAFATVDERQIIRWWKENPNYNICIPAGIEVEPGKFLGVIDIDVKEHNGFLTVEALELMGYGFPETLTQTTPSKGEHRLYYFNAPIGNGIGKLGKGIDHRGYHGYVLGAGSWYHGLEYVYKNQLPIAQAKEWLALRCYRGGTSQVARSRHLPEVHNFDAAISERRALDFLKSQGPAKEGRRNHEGFVAACRLKDFGVSRERAIQLLASHWQCEPALEMSEIEHVVEGAFKYGQNEIGADAPEKAFEKIPTESKDVKPPLEEMNDKFALIILGGQSRILCHTEDDENVREVKQCSVQAFHDLTANLPPYHGDGDKLQPMAKAWMQWKGRRTYSGFTFMPQGCKNEKFFNLWQGFSCEPLKEKPTAQALRALKLFKEHILINVAGGNEEHANWIFGWMAHMFQKPHEKPRTALVLRGDKGVGKSIIFRLLSRLAKRYSVSVANRRFLSGNFNAHLENTLLYCLEEAFWSGAKDIEGVLKDLVTNETLVIERKGVEAYTARNLLRVIILGNDKWIVPASEGERRYAVFDVGGRNRLESKFFGPILDDLDPRLLMKFFREFDLSTVDVHTAPNTEALTNQKNESLDAFKKWWLECLHQGFLLGEHEEVWPETVSCEGLRAAFLRENRNLKFLPGPTAIGIALRNIAPSCAKFRPGYVDRKWVYRMPTLAQARLEWDKFIGYPTNWPVNLDYGEERPGEDAP